MPLFVYKCRECEQEMELIRRIKDANTLPFCEECGEQMDYIDAPPAKMIRGKGVWSSPA